MGDQEILGELNRVLDLTVLAAKASELFGEGALLRVLSPSLLVVRDGDDQESLAFIEFLDFENEPQRWSIQLLRHGEDE